MQCQPLACHEDLVSHGAALHSGSGVSVSRLDCNWEVRKQAELNSRLEEISERTADWAEFLAPLTCSILDGVSHPAVDAPPLLPGGVDAGGVWLWLGLQVEGVQEGPPDRLQRAPVAPAIQNTSFI